MGLSIVILAAGQGKRMRSALPKVLHRLAGRALLEHVYSTAIELSRDIHVIYGHGGDAVPASLPDLEVHWVEQSEQLGTGHAVEQALPGIAQDNTVLVLYGDVPLITPETLRAVLKGAARTGFGLLTVELPDPTGYGRILRDAQGRVTRIVEEKDASDEQRAIREANTGMLAVSARALSGWLSRLDNRNAQGEYYLTDIIGMAVEEGMEIATASPGSVYEVMGVNDRLQLADLERYFQLMQARFLMREGVALLDPNRFDLRGSLEVGQDVSIDVNVIIEGKVRLGDRVSVGPNTLLRNVEVADDVSILANCVIEDAVIGRGSRIGPFSRIRPETRLAEDVHVGNFVEVKKSVVGTGSKLNHLSYIGDTDVGRGVNIGAGTITCNYDGANKYRTVIGDNVFVGSDTQLIAPVSVGNGATIGAGTTLTEDAPPDTLTVGRARQRSIAGWKRPQKKPK